MVDDDEGLLVLMGEALRAEGHEVATAVSGSAALDALTRDATRPELMLLDLKLKDTAADALLRRIAETGLSIPFVMVTGQGDEKVAVEMMRNGALDYVSKDTALLDLLPAVVLRALVAVRREKELVAAREQHARLEREILEVSANEQRRIGQDLHDGLGQQLTAIEILCAALKEDVTGDSKLGEQVALIGRMLRESIGQVRSLARGLVPVRDEPEALWASLVELAERTDALGRAACVFDCPTVVRVEDTMVANHLFRVTQEAVNNAVKHSGAQKIVISLKPLPGGIELSVSDDGQGLPDTPKRGLGLDVMQHRARVIGAELTIHSKAGSGTTIICRVSATR